MHIITNPQKRRAIIGALLCSSFALSVPSAAQAAARADGSNFDCRASAARVNLKVLNQVVEPLVANAQNTPCSAESKSILTPTDIGPVRVDLANAQTQLTPTDLASAPAQNGDGAVSTADVTNPHITLPGLDIAATVLSSRAEYNCLDGVANGSASSIVTNVTINGQTIAIPTNGQPFTLDLGPLGSLSVNQTINGTNSITQRALSLTTPVADVVIAESSVGFTGNPCALVPVPPLKATSKLTTSPSAIASLGLKGPCVRKSFLAKVTGSNIKHVTFYLDGRRVAVDKTAPFAARISTSKAGTHRVSARAKFVHETFTPSRKETFHFRRCAAPVHFTG